MQPENAELLQQIIDVQAEIAPLLIKYKDLLSDLKKYGMFNVPAENARSAYRYAGAYRAIAVYHGIKYEDLIVPESPVGSFMTLLDRMRRMMENARDGRIDGKEQMNDIIIKGEKDRKSAVDEIVEFMKKIS